jgi:hypothetical protein
MMDKKIGSGFQNFIEVLTKNAFVNKSSVLLDCIFIDAAGNRNSNHVRHHPVERQSRLCACRVCHQNPQLITFSCFHFFNTQSQKFTY